MKFKKCGQIKNLFFVKSFQINNKKKQKILILMMLIDLFIFLLLF